MTEDMIKSLGYSDLSKAKSSFYERAKVSQQNQVRVSKAMFPTNFPSFYTTSTSTRQTT